MGHVRALSALAVALTAATPAASQAPAGPGAPAMILSTTAFPDGGQIPVRFSQAAPGVAPGEGTSPPLTWTNTPAGTVSFVLHMHDMEVARNKTTEDQVHWLVWNIPGTATGLPEGVLRGSTLADRSRQISATGPMYRGPGAGATGPLHHYVFELYALDAALEVEPTDEAVATRTKVFAALQGHILGKAVYLGLFRRPN